MSILKLNLKYQHSSGARGWENELVIARSEIIHLMGTLKPQSNEPLHSNTVMVHWPLMCGLLHLVQRGRAWADEDRMQLRKREHWWTDRYGAVLVQF